MTSSMQKLLAFAFLAACLLPGPASSFSQAIQGSFPSEVELVNVDVIVLDKRGNPVEGLTLADFQLKEDGRPQSVTSFEAIALAESEPEPPRGLQRISTNAVPPRPQDRWFVVVFDDANMSQYSSPRARDAILEFLDAGLLPGDQVMLVPTSGGAWWTGRMPGDRDSLVRFATRQEGRRRPDTTAAHIWDYEAMMIANDRDRQAMAQVMRRYYENGLIPETAPVGNDDVNLKAELDVSPGVPLVRSRAREAYRDATLRLRSTLTTMERVSEALTRLKGHKTLLLVSEGFVMDPSQTEFRELNQAARTASAAVHFIDARSPEGMVGQAGMAGGNAEAGRDVEERDTTTALAFASREAEGARSVAIDTGGTVVSGTAGLGAAMKRIARQSRAYYLLGYVSSNAKRDGKFRKLEVSVARPDVDVRARRGYYGPSDKKEKPIEKDELDPAVRAALDAPVGIVGIPLRLTSFVARPKGKDVQTQIVAEADLSGLGLVASNGKVDAQLDSYVVVHGRDSGAVATQESLVEVSVPVEAFDRVKTGVPIQREFALPPGRYQARLLVRDRKRGQAGSVVHEFDVPAPGSFRLSTPILTDVVRPGEGGVPRAVPVAHRSFAAGSRVACAFEIFGASPDAALGGPRVSVAYKLRGPDGSEVAASPARALKPGLLGELSYLMVLSLPPAAQGPHELVLSVTDEVSTKVVEAIEPFEVARN
jgi:VWFA-related protein